MKANPLLSILLFVVPAVLLSSTNGFEENISSAVRERIKLLDGMEVGGYLYNGIKLPAGTKVKLKADSKRGNETRFVFPKNLMFMAATDSKIMNGNLTSVHTYFGIRCSCTLTQPGNCESYYDPSNDKFGCTDPKNCGVCIESPSDQDHLASVDYRGTFIDQSEPIRLISSKKEYLTLKQSPAKYPAYVYDYPFREQLKEFYQKETGAPPPISSADIEEVKKQKPNYAFRPVYFFGKVEWLLLPPRLLSEASSPKSSSWTDESPDDFVCVCKVSAGSCRKVIAEGRLLCLRQDGCQEYCLGKPSECAN